LIKLNTSLDIVAVPSTATAALPPPLPPDMANATFNGDGAAAAASPPARVLVIEVDTLLLPPHLLLMEEDDDDNDDDNDNGAMAKASALTNVAIARNAAAALALMMMFECGIFVVGSGTEEMIHSTESIATAMPLSHTFFKFVE
jgi:hypothetical protein